MAGERQLKIAIPFLRYDEKASCRYFPFLYPSRKSSKLYVPCIV
jgi:hypothetical protein